VSLPGYEHVGERDGPVCGCLGCHEPAEKAIRHPKHGRRTVCEGHVDGHEVVDDV